jgi:hypothetical protein
LHSNVKHLFGIGLNTGPSLLLAKELWKPDKVQASFCKGETVLLLVYYNKVKTEEFISVVKKLSALNCLIGVIPVFKEQLKEAVIKKFLSRDTHKLNLSEFSFFLSSSRASVVPGSPEILRGALLKEKQLVDNALANSKAIFFQGHAGPFDAGFGKWLVLCTRHLYKPSDKNAFVPCYEEGKCFRQKNYGRTEGSREGLIDPGNWEAALAVLDGCCVFPVPGSIYPFETSLLRSIVQGKIKAAILSHGVSSTPLSVLLFFLGKLAEEEPIAEAVRVSNKLRYEMNSVSSSPNYSVSPWIAIGDPLKKFTGFKPTVFKANIDEKGYFIKFKNTSIDSKTGLLLVVEGLSYYNNRAWDAFTPNGNWLMGVKRNNNSIYLWIGAAASNDTEYTYVYFKERPHDQLKFYKEVSLSLITGSVWLKQFISTLRNRNQAVEDLNKVLILRDQLLKKIEPATFAALYEQSQSVQQPLSHLTASIRQEITNSDKNTAILLCAKIPLTGGRLAYLWNPIWPGRGNLELGMKCSCKTMLSGYIRENPIYGKYRIEVSCPVCSLIGDVAAIEDSKHSGKYIPVVSGNPETLIFHAGGKICWKLSHHEESVGRGYACGVLYDPLGNFKTFSSVLELESGESASIQFDIPDNWPKGLNWVTVVFVGNSDISILTHDLVCKQIEV